MEIYPSLVTVLTLFLYFILTINVGRARSKYNVSPPATTGNPNFERVLRVQQNTIEQMVLFFPLLWIFSLYVSPIWGAGIGGFWILGRIVYAWGYYQAAEKRILGFAIASLSSLVLLIGSLVGIILTFLK
ncbi:MAPEG family protein [Aphanothece sacrum]|uniref:Membrane protein n=1 Tax=Aphanothece sacrum FPU1 TaxID=1920663 RepID=A0A401II33_APHSA|nr:MAPEG family protein [Aphanothece sacrum]GBF80975.1 membrane protein [Aphanothece sacrum FPU1]GBF85282.1 membrane protein [Aphanothece sacrum FPU3]